VTAEFEFSEKSNAELSMSGTEQPPNPEKDKATQAPEIPPYTCFLCGHKSMQLSNHRRHMLVHHGVAGDGVSTVHPDADAGHGEHQ